MVNEPCAIISPAGMLVGGSAIHYTQQIAQSDKNGIALVSYQGEGTPGRTLLDKRIANFDGKITKCYADVKRFEFSGHNSRHELFEILDRVKGNPKVLTVHGDGPSCGHSASPCLQNEQAVRVRGLTKDYGPRRALEPSRVPRPAVGIHHGVDRTAGRTVARS